MNITRKVCIVFLTILLLVSCGTKKHATRPHATNPTQQEIADISFFPQDLTIYAQQAGQNKQILDLNTQVEQDQRFNRIFFGPWSMSKTSISKESAGAIFRKARGYKKGDVLWTQEEWNALADNAHLSVFPSRARYAITVKQTDLREMPTHQTRFSEPTPDPKANPFDYFQYSLLPPGTPLFVAHTTLDGRWHFVECPLAAGWVDADSVALADDKFIQQWQSGRYAALIREQVNLDESGKAGIGTVLPVIATSAETLTVLVPVKNTLAQAMAKTLTLQKSDAVIKPLVLTPANMAAIGNQMLHQPYGWGGMFGYRDCSAQTRDLLTPFGVWLPRNSGSQAKMGQVISLEGLSPSEKEKIILDKGVPFLSLIGMRGHITLYIGKYKGRAAIFHNVWGVRIIEDDNDDARFVLGRSVITSITPGAELPNLYTKTTFADRIRTLSTPAITQ